VADKSEFETIAVVHLDAVYRAAVALCGRQEDARDLVQATYLKALERFDSFRPGTNCRAWLMRILRNTWIDEIRHRKVAGPAVPLAEELVPDPPHAQEAVWSDADDILNNFGDQDVIRALRELPEQLRVTLFLVDVEQFSQEEVAEITDVAVGTVKSRTSRARAMLKQRLLAHARDLGFMRRQL